MLRLGSGVFIRFDIVQYVEQCVPSVYALVTASLDRDEGIANSVEVLCKPTAVLCVQWRSSIV